MKTERSVEEIIRILKTGEFDALIGSVEDAFLEVKGSPYQLSASDSYRQELAKDVSALANANGGIILIGFRTAKDAVTAAEHIESCRPFYLTLIDTDQYRKTLQDWIYPPIHSIEIACYEAKSAPGKGVAVIRVPLSAAEAKPYVVTRTIEPDGRVRGTLIGFYERVEAAIPPTSAETIRGHLRDGMRFAELSQRLSTIEAYLGNAASSVRAEAEPDKVLLPKREDTTTKVVSAGVSGIATAGVSDSELRERVIQAEAAVERSSRPNAILVAASTTKTSFPNLFQSQSEAIVRLLERPPLFRDDGFAVTLKDGFRPAESIQGRLRRVVARGHKLLDLWKDGALIAVGPGDDDLLCWFTRSQMPQRKPGLPIRNFVLGEITLNFINLALALFKNAKPAPLELKFVLVLNNMTEDGIPCTLSTARDNRPFPVGMGENRSALSATISSSFTAPFENMDAGITAYQLLGELYAQFGFNYDDMPYIQPDADAKRVTPKSLFGEPWK